MRESHGTEREGTAFPSQAQTTDILLKMLPISVWSEYVPNCTEKLRKN